MKLFDFFTYQVHLFPQLTWHVTASGTKTASALLVLLGTSACYLLLSALISGKIRKKSKSILPFLNLAYLLSALFLLPRITQPSIGSQLAPFSLGLKFILYQLVFLILLYGNWFALVKSQDYPIQLRDYLRANYWHGLLSYSYFLFPVILFDVPMVVPQHHVFFIGAALLAISLHCYFISLVHKKSFSFLGLNLPRGSLPKELEDKLAIASQPIMESGHISLLIAKPGLRNALACSPYQIIVIGLDLIRHLSTEQLQAVLLHELGHLQDKKFLPLVSKTISLFVVLYLLNQIVDQANIFTPLIEGGIFIIGLLAGVKIIKKLRLRAEFVADNFVKNFSADIYAHFTAALDLIYEMSGIDKDYCKKHNAGHLDPDERARMVANGSFAIDRKSNAKPFLTALIATIILLLGIQFGYSYFFPDDRSEIKEWGTMHDRYHRLVRDQQYQEAEKIIRKALQFSVNAFGENHNRTYLSLNDLVSISLTMNDVPKAEEYAMRAMQVGIALYDWKNPKQIRSLESVARVRIVQERWQDAENIYQKILQLQEKIGVEPDLVGRTLLSLIDVYAQNNEESKIATTLNALLATYEKQPVDVENDYLIHKLFAVRHNRFLISHPEPTRIYFQQLAKVIEQKHGKVSAEYAHYLSEYSNFLLENDFNAEAADSLAACVATFDSQGLEITDEYAACLHGLKELARK